MTADTHNSSASRNELVVLEIKGSAGSSFVVLCLSFGSPSLYRESI